MQLALSADSLERSSGTVRQDDRVRVLVVEDEKRLAAGLKKGLEAEGFATDVALNGTDGLWMASENPYDAIVLDICCRA